NLQQMTQPGEPEAPVTKHGDPQSICGERTITGIDAAVAKVGQETIGLAAERLHAFANDRIGKDGLLVPVASAADHHRLASDILAGAIPCHQATLAGMLDMAVAQLARPIRDQKFLPK